MRTPNVERLADALQGCFNDAMKEGEKRADGLATEVENLRKEIRSEIGKQNRTLRLIWLQVKGKGPLPIDE